jgi:MoaA/NifB/PqqE/SkfB family radical SAM enzyme
MQRNHLELLREQVLSLDLDIYLQSGESLLHRDLDWFIQTLADRGGRRRVHLTSNGQLATKQEIPWHLLRSLCLSIDGRDPISSRVRALTNQEEVGLGVATGLLRSREDAESPSVSVSAVIRPDNYEHLLEYCRFWSEVGVDTIMLIHLQGTTPTASAATMEAYPHLNAVPRHLLEEHWQGIDVEKLNHELLRVRSLNDRRITIHPDLRDDVLDAFYASSTSFVGSPRRCNTPWQSLEVAADGSIRLSGICVEMDLGHLEAGGLTAAWRHLTLTEFRELLTREQHIPACARCCGYFGGDLC